MFILVSGGSASGKSEFAEKMCMDFNDETMYYIAAMEPFGKAAEEKIKRHRKLREGKGFETIEKFTDLKSIVFGKKGTVLLECMSNLLANEIFSPVGSGKNAYEEIIKGMDFVLQNCKNLVVVTNDVFSDGVLYPKETMEYIKILGDINYILAKKADDVIDVVSSVPVYYKKGKKKC